MYSWNVSFLKETWFFLIMVVMSMLRSTLNVFKRRIVTVPTRTESLCENEAEFERKSAVNSTSAEHDVNEKGDAGLLDFLSSEHTGKVVTGELCGEYFPYEGVQMSEALNEISENSDVWNADDSVFGRSCKEKERIWKTESKTAAKNDNMALAISAVADFDERQRSTQKLITNESFQEYFYTTRKYSRECSNRIENNEYETLSRVMNESIHSILIWNPISDTLTMTMVKYFESFIDGQLKNEVRKSETSSKRGFTNDRQIATRSKWTIQQNASVASEDYPICLECKKVNEIELEERKEELDDVQVGQTDDVKQEDLSERTRPANIEEVESSHDARSRNSCLQWLTLMNNSEISNDIEDLEIPTEDTNTLEPVSPEESTLLGTKFRNSDIHTIKFTERVSANATQIEHCLFVKETARIGEDTFTNLQDELSIGTDFQHSTISATWNHRNDFCESHSIQMKMAKRIETGPINLSAIMSLDCDGVKNEINHLLVLIQRAQLSPRK